jgi:hypothetical protein
VSSCQKADLQDQVTSLDRGVSTLTKQVESLSRDLKAGAFQATPGTGPSSATGGAWQAPERATLDADVDPARPLGTPGRFKDYLSQDPDPEYPPEATAFNKGVLGRWAPSPRGSSFVTESDAGISTTSSSTSGTPRRTQWRNPSVPAFGLLAGRVAPTSGYAVLPGRTRLAHAGRRPPQAPTPTVHEVTAGPVHLDTILSPQTDCAPTRRYYRHRVSEAIDDHTAVVRWKDPFHSISFTLSVTLMPEISMPTGRT